MTAMIGVMTTAFLIAVLSQKLLLSRWEKYVYNFVSNIELAKAHRYHAANVISYGWKLWKLNKLGKQHTLQFANAQRNFYQSINNIHKSKNARRNFTGARLIHRRTIRNGQLAADYLSHRQFVSFLFVTDNSMREKFVGQTIRCDER